jgi:hypothetical protein
MTRLANPTAILGRLQLRRISYLQTVSVMIMSLPSTGMGHMTHRTRESKYTLKIYSPLCFRLTALHVRSWSSRHKWGATFIVSAFTFITPVASAMIAPASNQLAERFDIHNTVLLAMTISIFVLAYGLYLSYPSQLCSLHTFVFIIALGPLFLGPLSEVYGRSPVLQISNLWFLSMCFACLPDSS